jgi:hypothetical protein
MYDLYYLLKPFLPALELDSMEYLHRLFRSMIVQSETGKFYPAFSLLTGIEKQKVMKLSHVVTLGVFVRGLIVNKFTTFVVMVDTLNA